MGDIAAKYIKALITAKAGRNSTRLQIPPSSSPNAHYSREITANSISTHKWSNLEPHLSSLASAVEAKIFFPNVAFQTALSELKATKMLEELFYNDSTLDIHANCSIYAPALRFLIAIHSSPNSRRLVFTDALCASLVQIRVAYNDAKPFLQSLSPKHAEEVAGEAVKKAKSSEKASAEKSANSDAAVQLFEIVWELIRDAGPKEESEDAQNDNNGTKNQKIGSPANTRSSKKSKEASKTFTEAMEEAQDLKADEKCSKDGKTTKEKATPTLNVQLRSMSHQRRENNDPSMKKQDSEENGDGEEKELSETTNLKILEDPISQYVQKLRNMQIGEVDIGLEHKYAKEKPMSSRTAILRLAHELASLATSLPLHPHGAIFLRYDSARIDLMKALITGPSDTPYESGCFEFDIYIPDSYPSSPPKVHFVTGARASVRFNPNLYDNGYVCLSLIGTWNGSGVERWNVQSSTLLQVLISLQSLVLCAQPYFNEPGYSTRNNVASVQKQSDMYSETVKRYTHAYAIEGWLARKPISEFDKIARIHLAHTRPASLQHLGASFDFEHGVCAAPTKPAESAVNHLFWGD